MNETDLMTGSRDSLVNSTGKCKVEFSRASVPSKTAKKLQQACNINLWTCMIHQ